MSIHLRQSGTLSSHLTRRILAGVSLCSKSIGLLASGNVPACHTASLGPLPSCNNNFTLIFGFNHGYKGIHTQICHGLVESLDLRRGPRLRGIFLTSLKAKQCRTGAPVPAIACPSCDRRPPQYTFSLQGCVAGVKIFRHVLVASGGRLGKATGLRQSGPL